MEYKIKCKEYEKAHPRADAAADALLKKDKPERISSENLEKGR